MDKIEEIKKRKVNELMKTMAYPDKPVEITDRNFTETIQKYSVVVVDCWAQWCGPCLMIAPTLDAMANDLSGKVVFGKLNVDHNRETAANFGIMSIPTLLIFKNGKLVDTVVGAVPREMIEAKLQPHFN